MNHINRMRFVYFLLCFISVESVKKLPPYIEQCYRYPSSESSQCLLRNLNNLRTKIKNGLPELVLPSLNPLIVKSATIKPSADFSCELSDLKLWNLEEFTIDKLEIELGDVKKWVMHLKFPHLLMEFDYTMKGKLLILQLDSHGPGAGNVTGIAAKIEMDIDTFTKNGKEYLLSKTINVTMDIDFVDFNFENLFKNNKELNDRANEILRANQRVIIEDFGPIFNNIIESTGKQILNSIFNKFPLNVLFPEKVMKN
jgi:hypothetical protein